MKPELLLYYRRSCPFCVRVLNHLNSCSATIPMKELAQEPETRQDLIAFGGKAQVPCLAINGEALYESDAIIKWISAHLSS
jgi:glutaredoxin 3